MPDRVEPRVARGRKSGWLRSRLDRFLVRMRKEEPCAEDKKRLTSAFLRDKAVEIRSDKCQFDYLIQKIRLSIEEIAALWQNDVHVSFVEDLESMGTSLNDVSHLLSEYAALLDFAVQELDAGSDDAGHAPIFSPHPEETVTVDISDIPHLKVSAAPYEAYDPYYEQTEGGISKELVAVRKNLEYIYSVFTDHIELVQYLGFKTAVRIPESLDGLPVTHIGRECFALVWRAALESIVIPSTVTAILHGAFRGCQSVKEIHLPDSLKYIGNYAFAFMSSLESIRIPKGVVSIGAGAFRNCISLVSVDIPDSTLRIGSDCFYRCKHLEAVCVGDGVIDIDDWAFRLSERLNSVTLGKGLANIGESAFCDCLSLGRLEVPENVMKIGAGAFYHRRGMTIGCFRGSVAESYAIENKLNYVSYNPA